MNVSCVGEKFQRNTSTNNRIQVLNSWKILASNHVMTASIAESGLSTINSYIFGVISILLNTLLIYVIHKRCPKVIGAYKYMMTACAIFDICFSIVYIVVSPTFAATPEMSALLIVNGGFLMSSDWGLMLLIVFVWLLCQSLVTPACLFVFRYLQICRSNYIVQRVQWLRCFLIVPFLTSSSTCALLCFAAWPTQFDLEYFTSIAYAINVNGNTTFLVATLHNPTNANILEALQSYTLYAAIFCIVLVMVTSMITMIFCSKKIICVVMHTTSGNTRQLHIQLCKTLVAQSACPFLLLHVPFYVSILAPLFEGRTGEASNYFPFLFAWCPAINPLITICFMREFRQFILSFFKKTMIKSKSSLFLVSTM
ncbi:hypothetical protein RB195_003868 [Necator americanus]|uniref:G-protein coupled receptors family 1 profile domain-containing protein n=1 Tax=Necator americanus TaxID=51031 RepID=A0ABR1DQR0_NECAM